MWMLNIFIITPPKIDILAVFGDYFRDVWYFDVRVVKLLRLPFLYGVQVIMLMF